MIHIQVVDHLLLVESRVEMDIIQDGIYEVDLFLFVLFRCISVLLAKSMIKRASSSSSNISSGSVINSSSNISQISLNDSLRTQCSCPGRYEKSKKII